MFRQDPLRPRSPRQRLWLRAGLAHWNLPTHRNLPTLLAGWSLLAGLGVAASGCALRAAAQPDAPPVSAPPSEARDPANNDPAVPDPAPPPAESFSPSATEPARLAFPEFEATALPSGLHLQVLPHRGQQLVQVLVSLAPNSALAPSSAGRAEAVSGATRRARDCAQALLWGGATTGSAARTPTPWARWGTEPKITPGPGGTVQISWAVATAGLSETLDALGNTLTAPTYAHFDATLWTLAQRRERRALQQPQLALWESLGLPPGEGELAAPVTLWECQRWSTQLAPSQSHVLLTGPLSLQQAERTLTAALGSWAPQAPGSWAPQAPRASSPAPPAAAPRAPLPPGQTLPLELIDSGDADWSRLFVVYAAPDLSSTEAGSATLAAGALEAQLAPAFAALSGLAPTVRYQRDSAQVVVRAEVATAHVLDALRAVLDGVAQAQQREPSALALAQARSRARERWTRLIASPRALLTQRELAWRAALSGEALAQAFGVGVELDAAAISATVQSWSAPPRVLVASDAKRVEGPLSSLRPVVVRDPVRGLKVTRRLALNPSASVEIAAPAANDEPDAP